MRTKNIFLFIIGTVLAGCLVSGGFFDFFDKITGRALSNQPTNLSVTVSGKNISVVTYVSPITTPTPNEAPDTTAVTFNAHVYDLNGVSDLNDSSVNANFTKGGAIRQNLSCKWMNDLVDGYTANYSCTVQMHYFDIGGVWNISVSGNDLGNKTASQNYSSYFTYGTLKAMAITPKSLTWSAVSPSANNQTSDNDPTYVNNTGNYNGTLQVSAIDLYGETTTSEKLPASNFTVGLTTGALNPECSTAIKLVNNSAQTVTSSNSNPGNLTEGGGAGQELIYYCIPEVPPLSSQVYSTLNGGSWSIIYP